MTQLYVKGEFNDNGALEQIFFKIPLSLIEEAQSFQIKNEDLFYAWLDQQDARYQELLSGIAHNIYKSDNKDYVKSIKEDGGVIIELEEYWFSVGQTKDIANIMFREFQATYEDDEWDEDEDDDTEQNY